LKNESYRSKLKSKNYYADFGKDGDSFGYYLGYAFVRVTKHRWPALLEASSKEKPPTWAKMKTVEILARLILSRTDSEYMRLEIELHGFSSYSYYLEGESKSLARDNLSINIIQQMQTILYDKCMQIVQEEKHLELFNDLFSYSLSNYSDERRAVQIIDDVLKIFAYDGSQGVTDKLRTADKKLLDVYQNMYSKVLNYLSSTDVGIKVKVGEFKSFSTYVQPITTRAPSSLRLRG